MPRRSFAFESFWSRYRGVVRLKLRFLRHSLLIMRRSDGRTFVCAATDEFDIDKARPRFDGRSGFGRRAAALRLRAVSGAAVRSRPSHVRNERARVRTVA